MPESAEEHKEESKQWSSAGVERNYTKSDSISSTRTEKRNSFFGPLNASFAPEVSPEERARILRFIKDFKPRLSLFVNLLKETINYPFLTEKINRKELFLGVKPYEPSCSQYAAEEIDRALSHLRIHESLRRAIHMAACLCFLNEFPAEDFLFWMNFSFIKAIFEMDIEGGSAGQTIFSNERYREDYLILVEDLRKLEECKDDSEMNVLFSSLKKSNPVYIRLSTCKSYLSRADKFPMNSNKENPKGELNKPITATLANISEQAEEESRNLSLETQSYSAGSASMDESTPMPTCSIPRAARNPSPEKNAPLSSHIESKMQRRDSLNRSKFSFSDTSKGPVDFKAFFSGAHEPSPSPKLSAQFSCSNYWTNRPAANKPPSGLDSLFSPKLTSSCTDTDDTPKQPNKVINALNPAIKQGSALGAAGSENGAMEKPYSTLWFTPVRDRLNNVQNQPFAFDRWRSLANTDVRESCEVVNTLEGRDLDADAKYRTPVKKIPMKMFVERRDDLDKDTRRGGGTDSKTRAVRRT